MPFTGLATHDDFEIIGEDVSDIMRLISPTETPLLDLLPEPDMPVTNVYHQWTEEELGPDTVIASTAVASATAATGVTVQHATLLQPGMLIENGDEVMQITTINASNGQVTFTRGVGGSAVSSLAPGGSLFVQATAELEGSETSGDVTRVRTRRSNYTQIFKKPITVSGTRQSVITAPNVANEFDHQVIARSRELLRDLEKSVIRSRNVANSIGGDSNYRSMRGLRSFIENINSKVPANSFASNPIDYVNDILQDVWNAGATDLDVLVCGHQWKRDLSATNASNLYVTQDERGVERRVEYVTTDFGNLRVVLSRWMPASSLLALASGRVMVKPLQGRSFQRMELAMTGDNKKGHVLGEYTLEIHHPHRMGQLRLDT